GKLVVIEWHHLTTNEELGGNATLEASDMVAEGAAGYCEEYALEKLRRLDFSQLAYPTSSPDIHESGTSRGQLGAPSPKSSGRKKKVPQKRLVRPGSRRSQSRRARRSGTTSATSTTVS